MDIKGTYNIENAPDYIQYADAQKKSPFDEIVYHLTLFSQDFFLQDLNACDLFLRLYCQPSNYFRKKAYESKTQNFISSDQDFRKLVLFYQSFYLQVFFQKLSFPCDFLTQIRLMCGIQDQLRSREELSSRMNILNRYHCVLHKDKKCYDMSTTFE